MKRQYVPKAITLRGNAIYITKYEDLWHEMKLWTYYFLQ